MTVDDFREFRLRIPRMRIDHAVVPFNNFTVRAEFTASDGPASSPPLSRGPACDPPPPAIMTGFPALDTGTPLCILSTSFSTTTRTHPAPLGPSPATMRPMVLPSDLIFTRAWHRAAAASASGTPLPSTDNGIGRGHAPPLPNHSSCAKQITKYPSRFVRRYSCCE